MPSLPLGPHHYEVGLDYISTHGVEGIIHPKRDGRTKPRPSLVEFYNKASLTQQATALVNCRYYKSH